MSNTIFIGNLSYATTEDELTTVIRGMSPGARVRLGVDRVTGRSRGFAFAEFPSEAEAAEAIRRLDGQELGGRRLRVNDADDRPPRSGPAGARSYGPPRTTFGPDAPPRGGDRPRKSKGSRRGLRARKRSLRW